jgi:hypothetical protein
MNIFMLLLVMIGLGSAHSEEIKPENITKDFKKVIVAPGVGKLRLVYEYSGEPVSSPAKLTVYVRCEDIAKELKAEELDLCSINKYDYAPKQKTLNLDLQFGRVDFSSKVFCDRHEDRAIDIGEFCSKAWEKHGKIKRK